MRKKRLKEEMTDALRRAALVSGKSIYAWARATDTPYAGLWRFLNGKGMLRADTAGRLAHVLGLRLVSAKRKKG